MKKLLIVLALALLLVLPASAEQIPAPEEDFYARGKEAVSLLSYGEYARALELLAFDTQGEEKAVFEARFIQFLEENAVALFGSAVQRDVSAAWRTVDGWNLAVPVVEPENDEVETLVLVSRDGKTYLGYGLLTWGEVLNEIALSSECYWNIEYKPEAILLLPDM